MSRIYLFLSLVLITSGMTACSSDCGDRGTASNDQAEVYVPMGGESSNM